MKIYINIYIANIRRKCIINIYTYHEKIYNEKLAQNWEYSHLVLRPFGRLEVGLAWWRYHCEFLAWALPLPSGLALRNPFTSPLASVPSS